MDSDLPPSRNGSHLYFPSAVRILLSELGAENHAIGLGFSPFARHYSGNEAARLRPPLAVARRSGPKSNDCYFSLFLCLLRCFTSAGTRSPGHPGSRPPSTDGRVSPFGHLRIKGCLPPPRSLSQAATSFIGFSCQGIHHTPLTCSLTTETRKRPCVLRVIAVTGV